MIGKNKKSVNPKLLTAQAFVNVLNITDKVLYSKDGYMFGYISVRASNDKLLSPSDRVLFFDNLTTALETETSPYQIISLPKTVDIISILDNLMELRKKSATDAKVQLLNGEIDFMKQMVLEDTKEPIIFIKVWDKRTKSVDENAFCKRLEKLQGNLAAAGVKSEVMDKQGISRICKIYSELNVYQYEEEDEEFEQRTTAIAQKRKKKETVTVNNDLLNMITPVGGIEFKVSGLIVAGTVGKIYSAIKYPTGLDYGWLSAVMNCTEAITCVTFTPADTNELADGLSKAMKRQIGDAETATDPRQRKKLMKNVSDADTVMSQIDEKNQTIGFLNIVTMPFADDETRLPDVCRRVETIFRKNKIKLKTLGNLQKEGFKHISPYYTGQEIISTISDRIFPLVSLASGSPMLINSYKDDKGFYFARTEDGNPVILDMLKRGADKTNSNFFVVGKPGTGKSTMVKSLIEILYMMGVKILIIDPEREYRDLCSKLGGSWLNAGGGEAKMNILQIRAVPEDDESEDGEKLVKAGTSDMAIHMDTLKTFFQMYLPDLKTIQATLLEKSIEELYNSKGIYWDTDITTLAPMDYPILSELYDLVTEKSKTESKYEEISDLLYSIAKGADSFIWNGHTNIETDNQIICFDTNRLSSASDKIKRTQYFNLIGTCWSIMSEDKSSPVAIIADEAYLMIDPEVPETMMTVRNINKRCRKYEGLLCVVTHQLIDFMGEKVKQYGQSLIDLPTYKFLFGVDAKNLADAAEAFSLTEPEKNVLQSGIQRHAIGIMGKEHLHMIFDLPPSRLEIMGKGGGR